MKKYYLHNGTVQEGPFDIEELKTKNLTRQTPVWFEPLLAWTTIGDVEELRPLLNPLPPPFTAAAPPPPPPLPQAPAATVYEPYQPYETPKSGITLRSVLYWVLVIAAIVTTAYIYNNHQQKAEAEANAQADAENKRLEVVKNIRTYVTATGHEISVGLFGGISNVNITVTNNAAYVMDYVRVQVNYIKQDGGLWKTEYLNFAPVGAYQQVTLKAPDSDRGVSITYGIVAIKSTALGLE